MHTIELFIVLLAWLLFEIVYGYNPLTPLDLTTLPQDIVLSLDGNTMAKAMKKLQEKVWIQIEKKNRDTAKKANKGRKKIVFQSGDRVWIHFCKERFLTKRS